MTRIIYNRLLGGWYVVRGKHQTPIGGRHDTRAEAEQAIRLSATEREILRRLVKDGGYPWVNPRTRYGRAVRHLAELGFVTLEERHG